MPWDLNTVYIDRGFVLWDEYHGDRTTGVGCVTRIRQVRGLWRIDEPTKANRLPVTELWKGDDKQ